MIEPPSDAAPEAGRRGVVAAVLAGGRASRIGGDKANLMLAGETLVQRAVNSLAAAGLEAFVVTKRDRPVEVEGVEVLIEPDRPRHALAGVVAAIREADGQQVIVLACDLPLLPVDYLAWLAGHEGGTVIPCPGGDPQPLAARYSPQDLAVLEAALEAEAPARQAVAGLDATFVGDDELTRFGDPGRIFTNVNTPDDLARAEAVLAAR